MLLQISEPGASQLPRVAIGIDLGTTHSLVAVKEGDAVRVLADESGKVLLPSVITLEGGVVVRSFKRWMGRVAEVTVQGKVVVPVALSAQILKALKERAESALQQEVTDAVITVPAYFDEAARQATKDAASLAGLHVLRLMNEPTAAALAYGLEHGVEGIYAIYDLGGGTFDVSLLKLEKGVFQVIATGGDTELGGDDIDAAIASFWIENNQLQITEKERAQLLHIARATKESLTEGTQIFPDFNEVKLSLSRKELNKLSLLLIEKTISVFRRVLLDAKMSIEDLRGVVLVGGATRMPAVRDAVKMLTGKEPLTNINPDEVVAIGAALQAAALTQGSDTLLLDVTPLSLGIETVGGIMERLIERNTPIPASHSQTFTTYQDGQTGMVIHVLQGERELVAHCRSIARFELKGIPKLPAGMARIEVTFQLDADGLLTVSAQELTTGKKQSVHVRPSSGLSDEQMEKMLRESMEHARDDIAAKLFVEAKVAAERLLYDIEQGLKTDASLLDKTERDALDGAIINVRQAILSAHRDAVDHSVYKLEQVATPFVERRLNETVRKAFAGKTVAEIDSPKKIVQSN